jgi:hypothetical protein
LYRRTKEKWRDLIERHIAWWNEVAAGVGLLIGYLVFATFELVTPNISINVITERVIYEDIASGYVPSSDAAIRSDDLEFLKSKNAVILRVPRVDKKGLPLIKRELVTFTGKGNPEIIVTEKEIIKGSIINDPESRDHLKTVLEGTGHYYNDKSVVFDDAISADIFAVRAGTLFAGLALILFLIRLRLKERLDKTVSGKLEHAILNHALYEKPAVPVDEETYLRDMEQEARQFQKTYRAENVVNAAKYYTRILGKANFERAIQRCEDNCKRLTDLIERDDCHGQFVIVSNDLYFDPTEDNPSQTFKGNPLDVPSYPEEEIDKIITERSLNNANTFRKEPLLEQAKQSAIIHKKILSKLKYQ